MNDEARRLLDLPSGAVGARVDDLELPSRLRDVLVGAAGSDGDQIVLRHGRVLVCNRMPVRVRDRDIGAVVTLRDRTELDRLLRELDGARSMTDALRAQAHEFSNRMHTVAGLIELGEHEEARRFIAKEVRAHQRLASELTGRIQEHALSALMLAKTAAAAERGVDLRLGPDTDVPAAPEDAEDLVTYSLVVSVLRDACGDLTAGEAAERAGLSRVSARRYLEHLVANGTAELSLRYGSAGRPEHRYRWAEI